MKQQWVWNASELLLFEVFVLLVLLVSWLPVAKPTHEIEILELFAGRARLCRLARALNIPCQGHDIGFDRNPLRSNMDINESAGFMCPSRNFEDSFLSFCFS